MDEDRELLVKSGYSDRAIEYYLEKVNVGEMKNPTVEVSYTGPCGDTMQLYLKIESSVIKDGKFHAIGCAGAFSSGSALIEMVKGKSLEEAEGITEDDIIDFLGGLPEKKFDCACLARRTLLRAIRKYTATI